MQYAHQKIEKKVVETSVIVGIKPKLDSRIVCYLTREKSQEFKKPLFNEHRDLCQLVVELTDFYFSLIVFFEHGLYRHDPRTLERGYLGGFR